MASTTKSDFETLGMLNISNGPKEENSVSVHDVFDTVGTDICSFLEPKEFHALTISSRSLANEIHKKLCYLFVDAFPSYRKVEFEKAGTFMFEIRTIPEYLMSKQMMINQVLDVLHSSTGMRLEGFASAIESFSMARQLICQNDEAFLPFIRRNYEDGGKLYKSPRFIYDHQCAVSPKAVWNNLRLKVLDKVFDRVVGNDAHDLRLTCSWLRCLLFLKDNIIKTWSWQYHYEIRITDEGGHVSVSFSHLDHRRECVVISNPKFEKNICVLYSFFNPV